MRSNIMIHLGIVSCSRFVWSLLMLEEHFLVQQFTVISSTNHQRQQMLI